MCNSARRYRHYRSIRPCMATLQRFIIECSMNASPTHLIPDRAQTLVVLRLLRQRRPMLMLKGDDDGYGSRWLLDGQQVQPVIAKYLMDAGFIADTGATELGARKLALTESGTQLLENGLLWWKSLGFLQRLRIMILG